MTKKTDKRSEVSALLSNTMLDRRKFVTGSIGAGFAASGLLSAPALAQTKPSKIVVNALLISWRKTLEEEVAPLFEKTTGIKVEFSFLPVDALAARLKAQLGARDGGIDVAQFSNAVSNWAAPNLADHDALFKEFGAPDDYNFGDITDSAKSLFTVGGKLVGIPYRFTTWLFHYQPKILEAAGISEAPATFDDLVKAAVAVTKKFGPDRYGLGFYGREGDAQTQGWVPYLLSHGGQYYNKSNWEILVNKPEAVAALKVYGEMATKHKVIPPESLTWEWDGMTAGGQADRFAMAMMIGPYATAINDPALSKTAGRWAWSKVPGAKEPSQSRAQCAGWALGVANNSQNKRWAFEFVKLATSTQMLKRSALTGNSPPRVAVLNDPEIVKTLGWAPAFAQQAQTAVPYPHPDDTIYAACDLQIRPHISRVISGQATAQEALDATAADWDRTMRRAGLR